MSITDLTPPSPRSRQLAPLIVIEGPDGTGKTTLARAIAAAAAPAVLIHGNRHGDDPVGRPRNELIMRAYHSALLAKAQEARRLGHAVVMNQHWLSHVIYGVAAGRLTPGQAATYRQWFSPLVGRLRAFYVFALDEACLDAPQDPDHPRDVAYLRELIRAYEAEYLARQTAGERVIPYLWRAHGATPEALERFARLVLSLATSKAPSNCKTDPTNPVDLP